MLLTARPSAQVPTICEADAKGSQVQGLSELESKFKSSQGNLLSLYFQIKEKISDKRLAMAQWENTCQAYTRPGPVLSTEKALDKYSPAVALAPVMLQGKLCKGRPW